MRSTNRGGYVRSLQQHDHLVETLHLMWGGSLAAVAAALDPVEIATNGGFRKRRKIGVLSAI